MFRPTQKRVFIQVQLHVSVLTNHQDANTILKKRGKIVKHVNLPHIVLFFERVGPHKFTILAIP